MKKINHLLNLESLSNDEVLTILKSAEEYIAGRKQNMNGKLIANMFFEPSTRTQYSFEAAENILQCKVLNFNPVGSSLAKGESLYDTIKTFEQYADCLVIRHTDNKYYEMFENKVNIPIINAGDGSGNHPTQSLLDLLTIKQEFKNFAGLSVAIVGDVLHSRVAHTNIEIMERLGMKVHLCAPPMFQEEGYEWENLDDVIDKVDIVMLLRVQHERHQESMDLSKEEYHEKYGLNIERVNKMKKGSIILHPAPFNRGVEIGDEVVEHEKSRIFKQMNNGVYIRMAVLHRALEGETFAKVV